MTNVFSAAELNRIVQQTIPAATDATHRNAVVGTVDQSGAQIVASFRRPTGAAEWTLEAAARHTWTGDNQAGASVILKW